MTNNSQQQSSSPPLPPLPASACSSHSPPPLLLPSSASSSPKTSFSSRFKSKPQAIAIYNSAGLEPSYPSPRRGSIAAHLMNFATRSTTSLQLLSSSAPAHHGSGLGPSASTTSLATQEEEMRSHVLPLRSTAFSNPFKKLQHTFHGNSSKKTPDGQKIPERIVSSSASAQSMTSWRSKGAEMLSKKTWGRTRKSKCLQLFLYFIWTSSRSVVLSFYLLCNQRWGECRCGYCTKCSQHRAGQGRAGENKQERGRERERSSSG